jgi:phosphoribosylanthranilate isomerase
MWSYFPSIDMWNLPFRLMFRQVKNLSDARFAAAAMADYISFDFDSRNANHMPASEIKECSKWLAGSTLLAEIGKQSSSDAADVLQILGLNGVLIQQEDLHEWEADSACEFILQWEDTSSLHDLQAIKQNYPAFKAILFPGNIPDHWFENPLIQSVPHFLTIDNYDTNAAKRIHALKPYGIAFIGEDEDKPGNRDFSELNEFIYELEALSSDSIPD